MKLEDDQFCFACGAKNPIGLNMDFDYSDNEVTIKFTPKKEHQGWNNIIHGGILSTLMDEAMAKLIIHNGDFAVTSRMDTRFLRPANVGEEITITAKIDRHEGKNFYASSKIVNSRRKILASCKGVYAAIS